jgi:integrase
MSLTDTQLRSAKKRAKPYRKSDGGGLYVLVRPNGAKDWRLTYRWRGKQRTLALGAYPVVSLADARQARAVAKSELAKGVNPSAARKERAKAALIAAGNTFETIAREWHGLQKPGWSQDYADAVLSRLEADVFPAIGRLPIASIEPPDVLDMLRRVEARRVADLAHRLKQHVGMVFRFAIATGRASRDPSADLKGALKGTVVEFRRRKIVPRIALPRIELPDFLRSLGAYDGDQQTRLALGLIVLTFLHAKELCAGRWDELEGLDGAEPLWRIPAERMKSRREHLVPLSRQAAAVLRELRKLTGNGPFMLPSASADGTMGENTCRYALCSLGYHGRATVHGFRGVASTVLNESGFDGDWVECQLAHEEENASPAARDSAEWLPERRRMMQWWADHLDALIYEDDNVVALARAS